MRFDAHAILAHLKGALVGLLLLPVLAVLLLEASGGRVRRQMVNDRANRNRRERERKVLKG